jgi:hypothetical protein
MIKDDLSGMLDELTSLPEKIAEREWPDDETIGDLRPQLESDGDTNPRSEIRLSEPSGGAKRCASFAQEAHQRAESSEALENSPELVR